MALQLETDRIAVEIEDGIGWLTFDRPERHNALSQDMVRAIPRVLDHFEQSDDVRVVVMKGAGPKAFVSGADISEFAEKGTPGDRPADGQPVAPDWRLGELAKPLVAMIHGYCIGGGLAIALSADIRIASEDAQFGIPAARLGLAYPFAGVRALVERVGGAYANEILFSARRFSAAEAFSMGLVNRVVPRDALRVSVAELAAQIAANAPLTVRASKLAVQQAQRDPAARDLARVDRALRDCFESEDFVEGRTAFLEKRAPRFKGR